MDTELTEKLKTRIKTLIAGRILTKKEIAKARRVGIGLSQVANVLELVKELAGNLVIDAKNDDLNFTGFYDKKPMAFSGIYAMATTSKEKLKGRKGDEYNADASYGERLIARECGFRDTEYTSSARLALWASENPELWGNENGEYMFSGNIAYGIEGDTLTLAILIAHLRSVSARCECASV